jgi:hypothetical protein
MVCLRAFILDISLDEREILGGQLRACNNNGLIEFNGEGQQLHDQAV